jgi:hypothetical protein
MMKMKSKTTFKNYTSEMTIERSIERIEKAVVAAGAIQFYKEYKEGIVVGVVFVIPTKQGEMPIRLPARSEQAAKKIYGSGAISGAQWEQAKRTAWANLRDWVEAQMALIQTEMVQVEEVFLPYWAVNKSQTLFEVMKQNDYKLPKLTAPEEGELS